MNITKTLTLAAVLALFAGESYADTFTSKVYNSNGDAVVVESGGSITVKSGGTFTAQAGSIFDFSGMTSSATPTLNPPVRNRLVRLTAAQINAVTDVLSSASGKTLYPRHDWSLYASGTAGAGNAIFIKCSGGAVIATIPIQVLVDQTPVVAFSSGGIVTIGVSSVSGCPVGQSVQMSATANLQTTTHIFLNMPYTIQ
jgi:hypothetical protein